MANSQTQKQETATFWQKHISQLKSLGGGSQDGLYWLGQLTRLDNIGGEIGLIREDREMSQWDVYYQLPQYGINDMAERILLSGMTAQEVAHLEEREQMLETFGLDIDDPDHAAELAYVRAMENFRPGDHKVSIELLKAVDRGDLKTAKSAVKRLSPQARKAFQQLIQQ